MSEWAKLVGATLFGSIATFVAVTHLRDGRDLMPEPRLTAALIRGAASTSPPLRGNIALLNADAYGHFTANVEVHGVRIRMLVDTGASLVTFSAEDAARFGLHAEPGQPRGQFSTANGVVMASIVRVPEMRLHGITVYDIEAAIMPPGALKGTLLGASFLRQLDSYEVRGSTMVLRK